MKRYAAHYIHHPEQGFLKQYVVEVEGRHLIGLFPLTAELEDVEWYPGVISLSIDEKGDLFLYLDYPFDFISMQSCGETRRRLLL